MCGVMMGTWDSVRFWIYRLNHNSLTDQTWSIDRYKQQSFTKYLRLTLVFEIAHYGKSLISVFQGFFANINKTFIFTRRLDTRLSFYEV